MMTLCEQIAGPTADQRQRAFAESDEDRVWFAGKPGRNHRVRRAFPAEAEVMAILSPLPSGMVRYTAVRQVAPGSRVRVTFGGTPDLRTDLGEAEAAHLFNIATGKSDAPDRFEAAVKPNRRERRARKAKGRRG